MDALLPDENCTVTTVLAVPSPVACFIQAVNERDISGMLEQFNEMGIVNDQLEEFEGKAAICTWAEREVLGLNMNISMYRVRHRATGIVLTAEVRGDFGHVGLPDPLILLFYITLHEGKIDQLIVLRDSL